MGSFCYRRLGLLSDDTWPLNSRLRIEQGETEPEGRGGGGKDAFLIDGCVRVGWLLL